VTIYKPAERDE